MKLSDIKLNPRNPQKFKDLAKLEASVKDFPKMFKYRPIVVDGSGMVLGGNKRLVCLQKLGFKEIPDEWVRKADDLTEEEQKRFIVADNVGFGEWNFEILESDFWLDVAESWGVELESFEVEKLEAKEDDYEPENEIETDIILGDLFEIGGHMLLCGDAFNSVDCKKLMQNNKADIVFTDPPYDLEKEEYASNISIFSENAHIFVMHDDKGIVNYLRQSNLEFKRFFVANFQFSSPRGNDPYLQHILVSHETNGKPIVHQNLYDGFSSIIKLDYRFRNKEESFGHDHQKPINFISKFIEHYSIINSKCLDLFGGSGSTMATCEQLKRICYTIELDPKNCQIIIDRMKKVYNLDAIKIT